MSRIHLECVGESRSVLSTLDKLKRIELRMEQLTRRLEAMPEEKVAIAQKVKLYDAAVVRMVLVACRPAVMRFPPASERASVHYLLRRQTDALLQQRRGGGKLFTRHKG